MENPQAPEAFKSQPWVLFDTIAARSFLMGDGSAAGLAIGAQVPAISAAGEIVFFQSSGRTQANMPWYTNLDMPGQLAYGFQVWQIYLNIMLPMVRSIASTNQNAAPTTAVIGPVSGMSKLMEAILNFGVLSMNLGQENQAEFPLSRFGAGGGMNSNASESVQLNTNGIPATANVMKLPEPIEMGRTQNLSAKIKLAPEVFGLIGSVAAPGVGAPLLAYNYNPLGTGLIANDVALVNQPFAIQLGLVGRRVKNTQYGQVVRT